MGERWWRTFRKTDATAIVHVDLTPHCRNDELAFELSPYGKPSALVAGVRAPVSFNVSHSGHHRLIALAERGRIGVDIEERVPRHDPDGPIRTVFSRAEREELAAAVAHEQAPSPTG